MTDPVKTKFKYDHGEDKVVLQNVQDVEPLLELNKKELTGDSMYGTGDNAVGMRKVASIPLVVIEKWKRELGVDIMNKNDWPKIKQLLNDPENRFFRTREGRL
jgi:ribosomal protein L32E|tara:strand:- start:230 stop:538 length:309 start_codon:yes stop_codon:yes gene_type:complete